MRPLSLAPCPLPPVHNLRQICLQVVYLEGEQGQLESRKERQGRKGIKPRDGILIIKPTTWAIDCVEDAQETGLISSSEMQQLAIGSL